MLSLFLEMPYLLTNPKHTEMKNKKCQTIKGLSPYYISSPTLRNNDLTKFFPPIIFPDWRLQREARSGLDTAVNRSFAK